MFTTLNMSPLPSSQQLVYRASWTRRFDQDIPWPDGSFEAHPGPVVRMVGGEVLSGRKVSEKDTEEEREGVWEVTDRDHCLYSMSTRNVHT